MDIILNSGHVIKNVNLLDSTKSPIGLFVWSTNQIKDNVLTFDKASIRSSQIAAIVQNDGEYFPDNRNQQQHIQVNDNDMPSSFGRNGGNY